MKFEDPAHLLSKVKDVCIIDLLKYAVNLDLSLHKALVEPQAGLYLKGAMFPFMKEGQVYYPRSGYGQAMDVIAPLKNVFSLREDVLDENGNIILTAKQIINMKRFVTLKPDIPVTAILLAKEMALIYLRSVCPYTRTLLQWDIAPFLKEEYQHLIYEGHFENAFGRLLDEVHSFINEDNWFYYFNKLKGTSLVLEKTVDIRIYEWHKQKYEEQLKKEDYTAGLY